MAGSRRVVLPCLIALCVLVGLTLNEVVPRHEVVSLHGEGERWQNHPRFLRGDCVYYRATLISLLEDGDLDLKNNPPPTRYSFSSNVALGKNGAWYPKHSLLMPIVAAPLYWIAGDLGLLGFNLLQLTALCVCLWLGARRYTSEAISFALVVWFAFGTMLRPSAYNFSPDVFSTLLVSAALLALLSRRAVVAGVLLGLSVWAKWTNLVFLPVAGVFLLADRDVRAILRFGLGSAVPILALLALNQHMFGSPWITPYDRVLTLTGSQWALEPSHRTLFGVPFWTGLWEQLTNRRIGLLVGCPPILLAPVGLAWLARRAPKQALLLGGACLAQFAMFAKYEQWQMSSYGPRFLMTVVAVGAWLAAAALEAVIAALRARLGREQRRASESTDR
jgi:hypothetical protein